MSIEKREITIKENGREIYGNAYIPEGVEKAPLVIFSHGYNGSGNDFEEYGYFLAENGICSYCFDFCGGSVGSRSSLNTTEMTIFSEKEDLIAVLNNAEKWDFVLKDRITLFGGSQGGFVTSLVAEESKEKINGVILLYPALCIPNDWKEKFPIGSKIPDKIELWGMELGKEFVLSVREIDIVHSIGSYHKKVLMILGGKDEIVSNSLNIKIASNYKECSVVTFNEEGHGFSSDGNHKVMYQTLEFVKSK